MDPTTKDNKMSITCSFCTRKFSTQDALNRHQDGDHEEAEPCLQRCRKRDNEESAGAEAQILKEVDNTSEFLQHKHSDILTQLSTVVTDLLKEKSIEFVSKKEAVKQQDSSMQSSPQL